MEPTSQTPSTSTPKKGKDGETKEGKCCGILVILLIILIALAVLLFRLIAKPRQPIFIVDEALIIQGYNLTSDNHLINSAFSYSVRAYNPSSKLSLSYEYLEVRAFHDVGDQLVFVGYMGAHSGFSQPRQNETLIRFEGVASDFPLFEPPGEVDLRVEVEGRLWYKAGSWKLHRYKVKAKCFPVVVYLDSKRGFQKTHCYVKLS